MVLLDEVKALKVQELRDELTKLGLDTKGLKAELQKRLEDALSNFQTNGPVGGQAPVAVSAEVQGPISTETIQQVAEAAAEEIAEADEKAEGGEPAEGQAVETITTISADANGNVKAETEEKIVPADKAAEVADVTEEDVKEAVAEAVEAADTAADLNGTAATAVTTVEPTKAKDDIVVDTSVATGQAQGVQKAAAPAFATTYRLFVGSVPTNLNESDLEVHFKPIQGFKEAAILREAITGNSRGCAFVVYDTRKNAEQAIAKLDKSVTLPGGTQPIEVRFAKEPNKIIPSAEPNAENKLFYARAPISAKEEDIKAVFSEFGEVTEVSIFLNRPANTSKGCGFVAYKTREQAIAGIENLHDKKTMTGAHAPLTVKWADVDLGAKKRKAQEESNDPNRDNAQLFYAKIPKNITEPELTEVFNTVAPVKELTLFKVHAGATTNKGCGIVTFESHEEAKEVLENLVHTFQGINDPMVLKWMDQGMQKRRRLDEAPAGGPPGRFGPGGPGFGGPGPFVGPGGPVQGGPGGPLGDGEMPPAGCAQDAFKLYLSNVPKNWEVEDLRKTLATYGQVVEMNIVRDKQTKEPRGVAFAWFKTRPMGERCINQLNNKLFDHGGQQKPISVAKARPRRQSGGGPVGFPAPGPGPQGPQGGPRPVGGYQAAPAQYQARPYGGGRPAGGRGGYGQQQPGPYYQQQAPGPAAAGSYNAYPQQAPAQQTQYNAYQAPAAATGYQQQQTGYSQPAGGYQQQGGYQAPAGGAAASPYAAAGYQPQANPGQQAAYTPTASAAGGYGQTYGSQQSATGYSAPAASGGYDASAAGGYGAQQAGGYGQQQASYGQQTSPYAAPAAGNYGAQAAQGGQTGYNYGQSTAGQTAYSGAGQTGYGASQTGAQAEGGSGYNYGQQSGYTQPSGGYNYGQQ